MWRATNESHACRQIGPESGEDPVVEITLARAVHVVAVIIWIGGVSFATTSVLPLTRLRTRPMHERLALFEVIEGRFVWQARITTLLVAASGFYMIHELGLWDRFRHAEYWWMHAMVLVWALFTLLLFVVEPVLIHHVVQTRVRAGDESVFTLLLVIHIVLLTLSLITAFAAVAGSHGVNLGF